MNSVRPQSYKNRGGTPKVYIIPKILFGEHKVDSQLGARTIRHTAIRAPDLPTGAYNDLKLEDKTVLISGSTAGIGFAIPKRFRQRALGRSSTGEALRVDGGVVKSAYCRRPRLSVAAGSGGQDLTRNGEASRCQTDGASPAASRTES